MLASYRAVFAVPGSAAFSLAGLVARFPLSMAALGLVLLVADRTGSYTAAGLLSACYVLAAAAFAPVQGRWADARGQGEVLAVTGGLYALGMTATTTAVDTGIGAPWPQLAAAATGLVTPQSGTMVRARWAHALGDRRRLTTAFAVESVADEAVFVIGPPVVTLLAVQIDEVMGLAAAALAAWLGSWALAAQRRTAPPRRPRTVTASDPLAWSVLGPVVIAAFGLGLFFGSTEVIVVAFSEAAGQRGAAGPLLAAWATGSLLAGLVVGALPSAGDPVPRLRRALLLLTVLFAPLPWLSSVPLLGVGMFVAGAMIAPSLIEATRVVEVYLAPSRLTEGLAWTSSGIAVGVAPGAAIAGWTVDAVSASAAFGVPLLAAALATAVAWSFRPSSPERRRR